MVVLQPAKGALPKPPKRRSKIAGGGRAPKEAGRRKEREFANQYDFTRVVGSGAFGPSDPLLGGDIRGEVGTKKFLLEVKSWDKVNARGEKTINLPVSILDKIRQEAEVLTRYGGVIFHPKGTSRYIAIFDWNDFYELLKSQEEEIERLNAFIAEEHGDYL